MEKVREGWTLAQRKEEFPNYERCPSVSPVASGNNDLPITGSILVEAGWLVVWEYCKVDSHPVTFDTDLK